MTQAEAFVDRLVDGLLSTWGKRRAEHMGFIVIDPDALCPCGCGEIGFHLTGDGWAEAFQILHETQTRPPVP